MGRVVPDDDARLKRVGLSMRRSILLTVLALGAQAAWAQDATDPTGDEVVVEETSETVEQTTDAATAPSVIGGETEVVEDEVDDGDEAVDDEAEVVEDETGVVDDETEVSEDSEAVRTDNRSARGAFRGGHHGQVSTLARAGLGPVFGKLRSQGYGDIAIEQVGNEITISAARAGETRQLVYDASTGALLSDVAGPSSDGILQGLLQQAEEAVDRQQQARAEGLRRGQRRQQGPQQRQGRRRKSGGKAAAEKQRQGRRQREKQRQWQWGRQERGRQRQEPLVCPDGPGGVGKSPAPPARAGSPVSLPDCRGAVAP